MQIVTSPLEKSKIAGLGVNVGGEKNKQRKIWNRANFVKFGKCRNICICSNFVKFFAAANMKKCRARYGLDQQNLWCKPCRWGFFTRFFSSFFSVFCPGSQGSELHGWFYNNTADLWSSVSHSDELWLRGVGDVLITASSNVLIIDRPTQFCSTGRHLCRLGVGGLYNYHQNQSLSQ